MHDTAIHVEHLSKRYRIGLKEEMQETLGGAVAEILARPIKNFRRLRQLSKFSRNGYDSDDVMWAVKDVSFDVKRGEVVGIIGPNGAGKSTLLKILSRITDPTEGLARIHGRVASLLEVGTGFHPELTGRDNVYLNGTVLGMTRKEIGRKFDEIVEFSGVEKFIDTPVKRYSSGMEVRLAFSVAAHLEPEILIVDEVLAVGDASFQNKCLGKMQSIGEENRSVLLVSHNMAAIRNLCPRTLLVNAGRIIVDGDTNFAIAKYLERDLIEGAVVCGERLAEMAEGTLHRDNPPIRFKEVAVVDQAWVPRNTFRSDEAINVSVVYECLTVVTDLHVIVRIVDAENTPIIASQNVDDSDSLEWYRQEPGVYRSSCTLPANMLGERKFYLTVQLNCRRGENLYLNRVLSFDVEFSGYNNIQLQRRGDAWIRPQLSWSTESLQQEELAGG